MLKLFPILFLSVCLAGCGAAMFPSDSGFNGSGLVTGVIHDPADQPPYVANESGELVIRPLPGVTYESTTPTQQTFRGMANY